MLIQATLNFKAKCACGATFEFGLDKGYREEKDALECPSCKVVYTLKMNPHNYTKMCTAAPVIEIIPQSQPQVKSISDIISDTVNKF